MATAEIEQQWIDKFQENLAIIRKVAGWTTQELADEIGVARQTISNLETGKSPMTKVQYLALRTVFNAEIVKREDQDLAKVITTLVDEPFERDFDSDDTADKHSDDGQINKDRQPLNPLKENALAKRPISIAMQALAIITGALASGTAAGLITYLMFPDKGSSAR
ncbi:transcriptional regulator [Bifidobacterium lemurum]|uniref:Transcriptional regulator n=1 Tax=Bifidobacterium lemurum TaxID=1603886 RepID=A0A261FLH1_9BIFI|nr:helix-turn-helix transcriptional regulator [Bifidobacterium lemurum]OZG60022.1 transcriptional regulator [Bifidobacterium lemurum]QOL35496.1 helix-turn-helix domain-containing protein [Bifidobacterium lemurum]